MDLGPLELPLEFPMQILNKIKTFIANNMSHHCRSQMSILNYFVKFNSFSKLQNFLEEFELSSTFPYFAPGMVW